MYAAQEIPQIDTEIAQKGHFRMETKYDIEKDQEHTILLRNCPYNDLFYLEYIF